MWRNKCKKECWNLEGPSADGYKVPPMKRERSVRLKYWSCNVKTVGLEEKEGEELS